MEKLFSCHLWNKKIFSGDDFSLSHFVFIRDYLDQGHVVSSLVRCIDCGQLYFYEHHADVEADLEDEDAYTILVPIEKDREEEVMVSESPLDLLAKDPRLQWEIKDGVETIQWLHRKKKASN